MESKERITFSFDDGFKLDLRVVELLKKYGLKAVFYIIVDRVGQGEYLSWQDVKDIDEQGFEIGSHTMSHPGDLKDLFDDQLHYEIKNSKDLLESVLGHPVTKFCYPRGRWDERVLAMVQESGYLEARITGKPGITEVTNPLLIPGTVHIFQRQEYKGEKVLDFAQKTIDRVREEGGRCEIWGHSKEIEKNFLWETLEYIMNYVK
jgi:peptidoglycan/xylan/chitin deacetylase (PgdA/CDA1 family)